MTEISSTESQPSSARALLKQLQDAFPVIAEHRPLAIGIDKQLLEMRPATDRKQLRVALGVHTHSVRYLKAMQAATQRFDLAGTAVGEVSEEQRALASKELIERFRKQAEEHKAAKAAKAAAEKQARAEQERAQKLDQLLNKFSRK
ncbi:ProQ/FINO family protein [Uliginosibacterium sp. H3]|uniref:ProQ/FINO family protein n=1 Tax=Uliginosibacterium silvisoli TaxID=3114758 RepID=A0ABU6JZC2_9RHOO|nr:ProQ/FINO family protein [Uliginosibacterium sp. H3]